MQIPVVVADPLINLCIDTLKKDKQALVFCNTKRGAESQAEKVSKKAVVKNVQELQDIAQQILSALESPTKQCKRLAACIEKGLAFHHAGLNRKQREIIEEEFRAGTIKIICATPTLAMGLDMPAFRSIIRDTKRFSVGKGWGMVDIPVLEYEQMSGRAGRPGKEDFGEAIVIAGNASEAKVLEEKYLRGKPEEIYSKLAVEPVLRTYLLSLIATQYITNRITMYEFFDKTFYAHQYADMQELHLLLDKMIDVLLEWEFITVGGAPAKPKGDFMSASDIVTKDGDESFTATPIGVRVAEVYLDPLTANFLIEHLKKAKTLNTQGLLHLLASTLEMRPIMRPKTKDADLINEWLITFDGRLLVSEPAQYSYEYDEFLGAVKTTMCLCEWIDEAGEEQLFELFGVTPGELRMKIENADWLLYSCEELGKLLGMQKFLTSFAKLRIRLEFGVKEELLTLLKFKGIGKKRARKLYMNGIKDVAAVKNNEFTTIAGLIGPGMAAKLKEQVGQKVAPQDVQVKPNKRKGQKNLEDW